MVNIGNGFTVYFNFIRLYLPFFTSETQRRNKTNYFGNLSSMLENKCKNYKLQILIKKRILIYQYFMVSMNFTMTPMYKAVVSKMGLETDIFWRKFT